MTLKKLKRVAEKQLTAEELTEHLQGIFQEWCREMRGVTWSLYFQAGEIFLDFLARSHVIGEKESELIHRRMSALNAALREHGYCVEKLLKGNHPRPDSKWKVVPKKNGAKKG